MWVIKTVTKEEYEICDSASSRVITGSSGGFVKDRDGRLICIRHIVSMREGTLAKPKEDVNPIRAAVITDNNSEEESLLEHEGVPDVSITTDSDGNVKQTLVASEIVPESIKAPRGRPPKKK